MAEAPGAQIGHYRIVGPIGSGGFATVYRAMDERFDTDVAIKVLAENHSLDPDVRERFLHEARLLRRLSSPHLVTVFDMGETERRQPYFVMELATDSLLDRRAAHHQPPTPSDVRTVVNALAEALGVLHDHDVVHRDVSPQNLLIVSQHDDDHDEGEGSMLAGGERLVLADLGFAKDLARHSGITVGGGTAGFSAPQQRDGSPGVADPRDDVFAASAVVMWFTTDLVPAQTTRPRVDMVLRDAPEPLAVELDRGVSASRAARHRDIREWRRAVVAALDNPTTSTGTHTPDSEPRDAAPADERSRPRGRRWPVAFAALAGGAALGAGTLVVLDPGSSGSPEVVDAVRDDGRRSVAVTDDGTTAAIFGPVEVTAGEAVTFEAGIDGGSGYFWITPTGEVAEGAPTVTVDAPETPRASVSLVVTRAAAEPVTVTFDFTPTRP